MRRALFTIFVFFVLGKNILQAQSSERGATHMFSIHEDNDFLNIQGRGTDKSYTNGVQFEYSYIKEKKSKFFIDRLMPKAGNKSVNIFGWSLTQLMFTPNNIKTPEYQPNDYPYAGALFVTHSGSSSNAKKKYSFQTKLIAGVRGPASFAREIQTYIHSVISYDKPMGWGNQLDSYPLFNINFTGEKQLFSIGKFVEVIGGVQLALGSLYDATSIYPLIRMGKMAPYFDGYLAQHGSYFKKGKKHKTQYYLVLKPENTLVLLNALVYGKRMNEGSEALEEKQTHRTISHSLTRIQFGVEIAHDNFGCSYLQTHSTEFNKGLYSHNWGNISIYFRW